MWQGVQIWRVVIGFILTLNGIFLALFLVFSLHYLKERRLISELTNMRTAVWLYTQEKGKLPSSLQEAAHLGARTRHLEGPQTIILDFRSLRQMPTGEYLDPFGSVYVYDPKTGWINSTTPGFETW